MTRRVSIILVAVAALGVVLWQDYLHNEEVSSNFAQQSGRDVRRQWLSAMKAGDWLFVEESANHNVIQLHEVVKVGETAIELKRYDKLFRMEDIHKPDQLKAIDVTGVPSKPVQAAKEALLLRGMLVSPALPPTANPAIGDWVVQMRRN